MRRLPQILLAAGLGLGLVAELTAFDGDTALTVADGAVGAALLVAGCVAWLRVPGSRFGPIAMAAGFAWFLGSFGGWALYLHRGPLAHLILTYPTGRAKSRIEHTAIAGAYGYAVVEPLAASQQATIVFAALLFGVAAGRYVTAAGPERRARLSAGIAAFAFAAVLVVGAVTQLTDSGIERQVLFAYDAVIAAVVLGLAADLILGRWSLSTVTGLVVELGDPGSAGTLRERLAVALGDPSLEVGYSLPTGGWVNEVGAPFELPAEGSERAVTAIEEDGVTVAALVHDQAVLDEPALVEAVSAAARLAVSNARLQAQVQARVAEVDASRRRIVTAADAQRLELERELRDGAERRLAGIAGVLEECGPELAGALDDLEQARSELRELARGIHPAILTEGGLAAALDDLAARSPIPVSVRAPQGRWPAAVEAAAYFLCAEALTNVAKYADASTASIVIEAVDGRLRIVVRDDGIGGADPSRGSGLRGLADRIEALAGAIAVESPRGRGTRVVAEVPLQ